MGFYDRDYSRQGSGRRAGWRFWSVTGWIIAINIAVFVGDFLLAMLWGGVLMAPPGLLMKPLEFWGHFSQTTALEQFQAWRFVTFQFLHADLLHLAFNMFSLYFFGPLVEGHLGKRRYLAFYLVSGAAGPLAYLVFVQLGVLISVPWAPMVGASAGVFGVLVAAARIAPDATVQLLFPPIPMRLKTFAWVLIAFATYMVLAQGRNAGGEAAHLGGAAAGFLLIRNPSWLDIGRRRPRMRYRP